MENNTPETNTPATEKKEKEASFWSQYKKEIIIGVIGLLLLIFIVQNSHEVEFNMIFTSSKISLIVLILFFFALGMLTAGIYGHFKRKELKKKIKELQR